MTLESRPSLMLRVALSLSLTGGWSAKDALLSGWSLVCINDNTDTNE